MTTIKIKKPNPITFFICVLFIWVGFYNIRKAAASSSLFILYTFTLVGVLCVLMFGTLAVMYIARLLDKQHGLVLTGEKLIFKPGFFQQASVNWKDIQEVQFQTKNKVLFILPIIENADAVIAGQQNWFSRMIMKSNFKQFNTPIPIFTNNYDYNIEQLKSEIVSRTGAQNIIDI